jgi:hypothetical protein
MHFVVQYHFHLCTYKILHACLLILQILQSVGADQGRDAAASSNRILNTILALHAKFNNPKNSLPFFVLHLTFSIHVPHLSNDLSGDPITRCGRGDEAGKTNGSTNLYKQRLRRVVSQIPLFYHSCYTHKV